MTPLSISMLRAILCLTLCTALSACVLLPQNREVRFQLLALAPPFNEPDMEYSALTWCGDKLLMVPQFPDRHVPLGRAQFYTLSKAEILEAIQHSDTTVLTPLPVLLKTVSPPFVRFCLLGVRAVH